MNGAGVPSGQAIGFVTARDGTRIAYAVTGAGRPLVKTANWLTHIEYDGRTPIWRHWLRYLSAHTRLVRYDERGNGLSDHDPADLSFERWVDDLECLVDELGLDRFALLGISQGGAVALEYAARHPQRVERIVLCGAYAQGWAVRGDEAEKRRGQALLDLIASGWGDENPAYRRIFAELFAPDAGDEETLWFTELQRIATEPAIAARLVAAAGRIDIAHRLHEVRAPTLVMHARDDARVPFDQGRRLAAAIAGATFIPLESRNHAVLEHDPAWQVVKRELGSFLALSEPRDDALSLEPVYGELTPRERSIAIEVANGFDNASIGRKLGISEKTVRNHLTRIFDKLGVTSRARLIVRLRGG